MAPPRSERDGKSPRGSGRSSDLLAIAGAVSGALHVEEAGRSEERVWEAYAATERMVALMKMSAGYETPGSFSTLPPSDRPNDLLARASELLTEAAAEFSGGEEVRAIQKLRTARNCLRSYLVAGGRQKRRRGGGRPRA